VIELEEPISLESYIPLANLDSRVEIRDLPISLYGYPEEHGDGNIPMMHENCRLMDWMNAFRSDFYCHCDISTGMSGGPITSTIDGLETVIGIISLNFPHSVLGFMVGTSLAVPFQKIQQLVQADLVRSRK